MAASGTPSTTAPEAHHWLLLVYRVPSEPTRLRAAVWRRLKALGAVYVQNSAAALPAGGTGERDLRKLHHDIVEMSGTALLLTAEPVLGGADLRRLFLAARDDEYNEIIDKCGDFLAGLEKEYANAHFTFAELEENEEDLAKLARWLDRIERRDLLGASHHDRTLAEMRRCETAMAAYADRVYAEQGDA
ncbi:MAG: Chromate resistance protein ChrB [Mycobacteriales bacterium]